MHIICTMRKGRNKTNCLDTNYLLVMRKLNQTMKKRKSRKSRIIKENFIQKNV